MPDHTFDFDTSDDYEALLAILDTIDDRPHDAHVVAWERAAQHDSHVQARVRAELDALDDLSEPPSKFDFVADNDNTERTEHVAPHRLIVIDGLIYPVDPVAPHHLSASIRRLLKPARPSPAILQGPKAPVEVNPEKKPWENADEIELFRTACQVSDNNGGIAWSLNLSQEKIRQLMKAAANGNDPMRPLTKEFNRQFHKWLGYVPPYSIGFEFNDQDRLHAHATAILREGTDDEKKRFRAASAAAGGKIFGTSGRGQVHTKALHDGFG